MDFKVMGFEGAYLIQVARDGVKYGVLVNMVIIIMFHKRQEMFEHLSNFYMWCNKKTVVCSADPSQLSLTLNG
jgi:hypothetical protein